MKLSLNSLLLGLKTVFFHPMLYGAILFHWAIIQVPLPPETVEEPESEELLAESIPIASSGSLNSLTLKPKPKSKPKPEEPKKKPPKATEKAKPKPKPLAQALAKDDPLLKQKAEEERQRELEAKKLEEEKLKAEKKEKKPEEQEEEKEPEEQEEEKEPEEQEEEKEPEEQEEEKEPEEQEEEKEQYQGTGEASAVGFNLRLLPQPDLVFTPQSIQNYTDQIGGLEYQTNVQTAEWMTQTTSIDDAIAGVKEKPEYSAYSFDKVLDEVDNPLTTLYQLTQEGEETIYMSFIKSKKRTLRSSTVFVRWKNDPTAS